MSSDFDFKIKRYSLKWITLIIYLLLALGSATALGVAFLLLWKPKFLTFWIFPLIIGAMILTWSRVYRLWWLAVRVRLLDMGLEVDNGFCLKKTYPYQEIVRLEGTDRFSGSCLKVYTGEKQQGHTFELSPRITGFGEMIENLLPRLTNLRELSGLKEMAEGKGAGAHDDLWQKEPNWEILQAATVKEDASRDNERMQARSQGLSPWKKGAAALGGKQAAHGPKKYHIPFFSLRPVLILILLISGSACLFTPWYSAVNHSNYSWRMVFLATVFSNLIAGVAFSYGQLSFFLGRRSKGLVHHKEEQKAMSPWPRWFP